MAGCRNWTAPVRDPGVMIVALTANASDEDRARYLGAGMDAFLAKPIQEDALHQQLWRAIERQLDRGFTLAALAGGADGTLAPDTPSTTQLDAMFGLFPGTEPAGAPVQPAPPRAAAHAGLPAIAPPAGAATGLPQVAPALQARLRAAFRADLSARRAELDRAVAQEDADVAGRVLHGLRGSAAYLHEPALHVVCAELESAADNGRWDTVRAGMPRLAIMLDAFAVADETTEKEDGTTS
jgi:HPt (histidine-containing phosphotransfer) domain-containing protein